MARFDKLEFDDPDEMPDESASDEMRIRDDEQHWMGMADWHRRTGNYENALRFYSRALEVEKSLVDAWVGQVQMLVQLGEYPQASMWANKALELFPAHGDLVAGRAQAEARRGKRSEAMALSDQAISLQGQSAYRWQVRGELMVMTQQKTDRHCFDKAQGISTDALVPLETGLIYMHHRSYVKALQRIQIALEKQPDAHYAWYLRGRCQLESGLAAAAIVSFERCREISPGHHEAGMRLAELHDSTWNVKAMLGRLIRRTRTFKGDQ